MAATPDCWPSKAGATPSIPSHLVLNSRQGAGQERGYIPRLYPTEESSVAIKQVVSYAGKGNH